MDEVQSVVAASVSAGRSGDTIGWLFEGSKGVIKVTAIAAAFTGG
jgi:hypothetical protein